MSFKERFRHLIEQIRTPSLCFLLLIKHVLLFRRVSKLNVFGYNKLIISDLKSLNVFWDIENCICIKISGIGIIPGSASGIYIKPKERKGTIKFQFIGLLGVCRKQVIFSDSEVSIHGQMRPAIKSLNEQRYLDGISLRRIEKEITLKNLDLRLNKSKFQTI